MKSINLENETHDLIKKICKTKGMKMKEYIRILVENDQAQEKEEPETQILQDPN